MAARPRLSLPLDERRGALRDPWVLVSGGFHDNGGQPRANASLARYLSRRGHRVHLVAHDIAAGLVGLPGVTAHVVPRPAGIYMMGWVALNYFGRKVSQMVRARDAGAR